MTTADLEYAEQMGRDCAVNGPNMTNCHFALFQSPELTAAWERGKQCAIEQPAAPKEPQGGGKL